MSFHSFDESSNLVIEVTSPTEKEQPSASGTILEDSDSEKSNFKEKHKGGLHFIKKRAKSPFRNPLKSPIKSPLKSAFKSSKSSKSTKSQSEELLSEDYKEIDKKIGEKKSEEWQIFQQMQERIKQNVLKTQSSLSKLSSSEGETDDMDEYNSKKLSDCDDNLRVISEDNISDSRLEDTDNLLNLELRQLPVNPVLNPRSIPKPPANSLRTSMENLNEEEMSKETSNIEVDLLGLSEDTENANVDIQAGSTYINRDLLELDTLMVAADSPFGSSMYSSFDESSEMTFGSNIHSARSSERTTPLGFDEGSWIGPSQTSGITSKFVSDMVDEFLQLDTMKEAAESINLNPFETKSSENENILNSLDPFASKTNELNQTNVEIQENSCLSNSITETKISDPLASLDVFGLDVKDGGDIIPSKGKDFQGIPSVPVDEDGTPIFDPFNGCKDNTLGRSVSPHVYDNFGFGLTDKSNDQMSENTSVKPDLNNKPEIAQNECQSFEILNPFLTDENLGRTGDVFEDKFLEMTSNSSSANIQSVWGLETESTSDKQAINPFKDDIFSADSVSGLQNTTKYNPFLVDTCQEEMKNSFQLNNNPFLDVVDVGGQETNSTDISDIDKFLAGDPVVPKDENVLSINDFDPFQTTVPPPVPIEEKANDALDLSCFNMGLNQVQDSKNSDEEEDKDEDDIFKLKIKPIVTDPSNMDKPDNLGPIPVLKPPPKTVKSPQPPRENPFDRDSPPEEDFAKFEIMHEKEDSETEVPPSVPEHSMSFSTTESMTPEEELNLEPLEPFCPEETRESWRLMLRQPTKKKLTTNRFWKEVIARIVKTDEGPVIKLFNEKHPEECYHELTLQPCYSVSDVSLQHYDQYGKIHTMKVQYIFYRERVGIKAERITPSFVNMVKKPKATMILDHAPQVSEMMKFGTLDKEEINSFKRAIENTLMNLDAHREKTLSYVKEEVCVEVIDEYVAELDKSGKLLNQKARVRVFFLAFITGMPTVEIGINDKRRDGKEVVGRHDIIPIKTEEWIRLEDVEFHCCVNKEEFEKTNNIKFHPLDACQFEVLRYRVRLRHNKELPLQLKIQQILKDKKFEIRCDLLVTGYHSFSKKHGQFPCEDIEIHFPIPEPWIYLFRYEKRFGYGSFKAATRKPGKIKGLERLTMIAQGLLTPTLMEADVGNAKYENLYRAVVWRIPRLPERNEGAYKSHLFKMTLELGAHDQIPDTFEQFTTVEFTMPSCTVSQTQVRSVSVENPTPPEKWVKYIAKYFYNIEIEHKDERTKNKQSHEDLSE